MKRFILIIAVMMFCAALLGCGSDPAFEGVICEVDGDTLTVIPNEGEDIRASGDLVLVDASLCDETLEAGDSIRVIYTGEVMESYPLQINIISVNKTEA